jgi:hypothetical protein
MTAVVRFRQKQSSLLSELCNKNVKSLSKMTEISRNVAGSGIEPESGGYAYHYSFRYSINRFGVWTIPLSFCIRKVRYLPSSLYTFRNIFILRLGSVLPCSQFASKRRFHRIWQGFHVTFLWMSPIEPPEVPLL